MPINSLKNNTVHNEFYALAQQKVDFCRKNISCISKFTLKDNIVPLQEPRLSPIPMSRQTRGTAGSSLYFLTENAGENLYTISRREISDGLAGRGGDLSSEDSAKVDASPSNRLLQRLWLLLKEDAW
jgi:hypothetical protein